MFEIVYRVTGQIEKIFHDGEVLKFDHESLVYAKNSNEAGEKYKDYWKKQENDYVKYSFPRTTIHNTIV